MSLLHSLSVGISLVAAWLGVLLIAWVFCLLVYGVWVLIIDAVTTWRRTRRVRVADQAAVVLAARRAHLDGLARVGSRPGPGLSDVPLVPGGDGGMARRARWSTAAPKGFTRTPFGDERRRGRVKART